MKANHPSCIYRTPQLTHVLVVQSFFSACGAAISKRPILRKPEPGSSKINHVHVIISAPTIYVQAPTATLRV